MVTKKTSTSLTKKPGNKDKPHTPTVRRHITKPYSFFNIPFFNKGWQFFAGIVLAIGFIVWLDGFLKTDKEKFDEENVEVGVVHSHKISNYSILDTTPNINKETGALNRIVGVKIPENRFVTIQIGGHLIIGQAAELKRGIEVFHPIFNDCTSRELKLMVKNDRLFISTKFYDLQTQDEIGEIKSNQWTLYKSNMLDYEESDNKFEVKDKHGNIVFSVFFADHGLTMLTIAGYFVDNNNVLIVNNLELFSKNNHYVNDHDNECASINLPDWKKKCQFKMAKIQSVFTAKTHRPILLYSILICLSLFAVIYCGAYYVLRHNKSV